MKRMAHAVVLLTVFLLLLNAGCYTVLQHPTGGNVVQESTHYQTCGDCHADAAYYHPYSQPYYSSHYNWGGYYGSPWWYDDYWCWDPGYDDGDYDYVGPRVQTGTRHLWSTGGWVFGTSGSSTRSSPPPASQPSQKSEKKKSEAKEKTKEKEKEKEKKKDNDERDLWKKPTRSRG